MGLHQTKNLLHSKGNNQQSEEMGEEEWEKIFAKHTSDKRLKSKKYKELTTQ